MTHMTAVMMKLPVAQMRQTENMAKLMYLVSLKSLDKIFRPKVS